jgi:hypothetical protein
MDMTVCTVGIVASRRAVIRPSVKRLFTTSNWQHIIYLGINVASYLWIIEWTMLTRRPKHAIDCTCGERR